MAFTIFDCLVLCQHVLQYIIVTKLVVSNCIRSKQFPSKSLPIHCSPIIPQFYTIFWNIGLWYTSQMYAYPHVLVIDNWIRQNEMVEFMRLLLNIRRAWSWSRARVSTHLTEIWCDFRQYLQEKCQDFTGLRPLEYTNYFRCYRLIFLWVYII